MLRKLFKHEFNQTFRYFVPLYIIMPILFVISGILNRNRWDSELVQTFAVLSVIGVLVALGIVSIYVTAKRFSQGIYSDEGYLTNTLPVKASQIVTSRILVIYVFNIFTTLITIISFSLLVSISLTQREWSQIFAQVDINAIKDYLNLILRSHTYIIPILLLATLISPIHQTLQIYASISIAHLKHFNKHKYLAGFGSYIVISIITSVLSNLLINTNDLDRLTNRLTSGSTTPDMAFINEFIGMFFKSIVPGIVLSLILIALLFFGTVYMIKEKLELE